MKTTAWPSNYPSKEVPIPTKFSPNPEDILVELRLLTRERHKFFEKIFQDHPHFCVISQQNEKSPEPDLVLVEAGFDHYPAFSYIESIVKNGAGPDIFLTSAISDASLPKKAFQMGVKEVFPASLNREGITAALSRYSREKGKKPKRRRRRVREVISLLGARGGLGTTTAAVNLGLSLQNMKDPPSVVLLELNRHAGDIELFLNTKLPNSLRELGNTISTINETTLKSFLGTHSSGLQVLSSGNTDFQIKKLTVDWIEPLISHLQSRFDFILIDCGSTLDATTTAALGSSSQIIMVSTLSSPVLKRTQIVLDYLLRGGIPAEKIHWLVNRYISNERSLLQEAERICRHRVSWTIPNDFPRTHDAMNSGRPFVNESPKSAVAKGYRQITSYLVSNPDIPSSGKSGIKQWVHGFWSKT